MNPQLFFCVYNNKQGKRKEREEHMLFEAMADGHANTKGGTSTAQLNIITYHFQSVLFLFMYRWQRVFSRDKK